MLLEKVLKKPDPKEYLIGSKIEGVLVANNKALANTKIIRKLSWNGNEAGLEETFETNEHGVFVIPAFTKIIQLGALSQFVAHSDLSAIHLGEQKEFWREAKLINKLHDHIDDNNRDNLVCDIENSIDRVETEFGLLGTSCTWDNMPKEIIYLPEED